MNLFKKVLTLFLLSLSINCYSQESLKFSKIITIDSIGAKEIYNITKKWVIESFNSPGKVIQIDDSEQNLILVRAKENYSKNNIFYVAFEGWVNYTIQIQTKDGRLKVELFNFSHQNLERLDQSYSLGEIYSEENPYTKMNVNVKKYRNEVSNDINIKMKLLSDIIYKNIETYISKYKIDKDNW